MLHTTNPRGPVVVSGKQIAFAVPFGLLYVAGFLREHGEDVHIAFWPDQPSRYADFLREVAALRPVALGLGGLYPDLYEVREIIRLLRQESQAFPVVIGGQMVSPIPEFAVEVTGADAGVIGEGEIIFHRLVTALREGRDLSSIQGLAIRDGDGTLVTGLGPYIEDLSQLPSPAFDLIPLEKWINIGRFYVEYPQPHWRYTDRVISVHGGRGCPFRCNFCYHHSRTRYRAIPEMLGEAGELLRKHDANMLYFGDDLAIGTPSRATELVAALRRLDRRTDYSVSCRFDILSGIDDALLGEMKATGCRIMGLGVESGSQRILDAMHKRITVEQVVDGLRRLSEVGIMPTVSIMVGQLGETLEDVAKSKALMIESVRQDKLIQWAFTITTPFPGSELYEIAFQKGILKDHIDFFERFSPTLQLGGLSVNLSAMSDEEVTTARADLQRNYLEEKERAVGRSVTLVEGLRRRAGRLDQTLRRRIPPGVAASRWGRRALATYQLGYDLAQKGLDWIRLKLYGVR